jgi:hypothetical protein
MGTNGQIGRAGTFEDASEQVDANPHASSGHMRAFIAPSPQCPSRQSSSEFRTIQDALKYLARWLGYSPNPRRGCTTEGDTTMSPCWACGGAPPSWFFVCEECGGRAVSSKSAQEEMERVERDYWQGAGGQYSNPFRSRPPELGFIAPAIPNPVLFCGHLEK